VKEPAGPGVRCDSGIWTGCEVSVHYDPILSKLVVWDETREQARRRMVSALRQYVILGIKTTVPFLADVMEHPAFTEGRTHTGFIPEHFCDWKPGEGDPLELRIALVAATALGKSGSSVKTVAAAREVFSPWNSGSRWRIAGIG
jgi:acetyl/propionyl-CoA carboxylase alpha subunit